MMLWPYLFLILTIVSTGVAVAGVSSSGIFGIAAVSCFLLFIVMTLRTFRKYRLLR